MNRYFYPYSLKTGVFTGAGFSADRNLESLLIANTPDGCGMYEACEFFDIKSQRVDLETGELVTIHPDNSTEKKLLLAQECKDRRSELLAASDWTQLPDAALTDEQREEWRAYRQALRDITQQAGFPTDIRWPEAP